MIAFPIPRRIVFIGLPLLGLFFGLGFTAARIGLFEPTAPPTNVVVSNVRDTAVTLSWTTAVPTRGRVVVSKDGSFPIIPERGNAFRDDMIERAALDVRLDAHHATIRGLMPATTYVVKIYQGIRTSDAYTFTTLPEFDIAAIPQPVYGQILHADRRRGVAGAIVYIVIGRGGQTATLSTLTDRAGHWQADLTNARAQDGGTITLDTNTRLTLIVEAGARGRVRAVLSPGKLAPAPDIVLPEI